MNKAISGKKKIIFIAVASAVSLLLCIGIGAFVWYKNSPFPTAIKIMSALKERDIDTVLGCIEPEASQKIELLMRLTGISAEDLTDGLLSLSLDKENGNGGAATESISVKFAGYERNGDRACIRLTIANGEETTTRDINFVRISDTWYLDVHS